MFPKKDELLLSYCRKDFEMKSELTKSQIAEASRYLPGSENNKLEKFAERQMNARRRLAILKKFYAENFCRLTRLHLLAACAIALGRFCGVSKTFDEIGELLMPCGRDGTAKNEDWKIYTKACRDKMPLEIRDELWLAAHFKDIENVRAKNLEEQFYSETSDNPDEPIRRLLQQHLEVTLGVRLLDKSAIAGLIPHETAIAESLSLTTKKLFTASIKLVGRYAAEFFRAVFDFSKPGDAEVLSYRRTAFEMSRNFLLSFSVSKIFSRGIRERERGRKAETENWNLLETVLGEKISEINPMIRDFYKNPSRFDVIVNLKLETIPAKLWSRVLTVLLGQGLFEYDLQEIPAQFRVYRRADGSMHFVRELFCRGKYRVFDSDFVVENGKFYEVFLDLNSSIEMEVSALSGGGLSIRAVKYFYRNLRMPNPGFDVEFQSRAENETLYVTGQLMMRPKTKFGRFFAYEILRRPQKLGSIQYRARRKN